MAKKTKLRFSRENLWTVSGFVLDSFENHQPDFTAVLGDDDFGPGFLTAFAAARAQVKTLTGASLRWGEGTLVTERLYENLDKLRPLLDRLEVRLGLLKGNLTVPGKSFDLKTLRQKIDSRNVEAVSQRLTALVALIGANRPALATKGYKQPELDELTALQEAIDEDNAAQNTGLNESQETTADHDAEYLALDALLGKVMRAGRLLFKADKVKRQQYTRTALLARVQAGERPKARPGDPA